MTPFILDENAIRTRLQAFRRPPLSPYDEDALPGAPRPAAVLVPMFWDGGDWQLLFIRRTINHRDPHSGQVAFPGGRADPDDLTPMHTALREANEEIGLAAEDVDVLGVLPLHRTASNFWVAPVVGRLRWPVQLTPSPDEVARIFTVPLGWLSNPAHREIRTRVLGDGLPTVQATFFQPYQGEVIWGATARMVLTLLEALDLPVATARKFAA